MKDTEKKAKVFVVQEVSKFNIISAQQYGQLIPLYEEGKQIMLSPGPAIRKAKSIMKDFSDDDYLLLMGDPVAMGIACAIASEMNRGRIQCLKWDRMENRYYPVKFNLFEKGEIDD